MEGNSKFQVEGWGGGGGGGGVQRLEFLRLGISGLQNVAFFPEGGKQFITNKIILR